MAATAEQTNIGSLLEASIGDAERIALRREALETMRRGELAKEKQAATIKLNDGLRQDPRAILVSDPTFARSRYQITLTVGEQAEPITVQSDRLRVGSSGLRESITTSIYTGEASADLAANPTDTTALEPTQVIHDFLHSYRGGGTDYSLRDMQMDVAEIMLLEALAEQLSPPPVVNTAAQVGHAVMARQVG